MMQQWREWYF